MICELLFLGDVVGRTGREAVLEANCPDCGQRLELDFVVVNGENAAGGFGITDEDRAASSSRPAPTA